MCNYLRLQLSLTSGAAALKGNTCIKLSYRTCIRFIIRNNNQQQINAQGSKLYKDAHPSPVKSLQATLCVIYIYVFLPFQTKDNHHKRNMAISLVLALKRRSCIKLRQVEGRPLSWSCNQCDKILTGSEIWVDCCCGRRQLTKWQKCSMKGCTDHCDADT